ncbi:hypothetical protein M9Y10_033749 [Tritrichomonas musculus]|uniref:Uncharacterized protein n=1 Tax=Tritrichomonas musculus TaxID=1915356 RepID=A0ABR2KEZ1_9EUKA
MLSGFFDDIQEDDSIVDRKKTTEHKSDSNKTKTNPRTYSSKKTDHNFKPNGKPKQFENRNETKKKEDNQFHLKDKTKKKKYPSPPRPPLPPMKPIKEIKSLSKNISADNYDKKSKSDVLNENTIMDFLLSYQKQIIDNVSNFRTDSMKQIDIMMKEIDKVDFSKYKKK